MMRMVFIGIGAGAAAALLFASVASGALLSILLFYLAPLPLMIAALGWSHWAGLIGAVHLAPRWIFEAHDVILAVDIGGSNIRAGVVTLNMKKAPDLPR